MLCKLLLSESCNDILSQAQELSQPGHQDHAWILSLGELLSTIHAVLCPPEWDQQNNQVTSIRFALMKSFNCLVHRAAVVPNPVIIYLSSSKGIDFCTEAVIKNPAKLSSSVGRFAYWASVMVKHATPALHVLGTQTGSIVLTLSLNSIMAISMLLQWLWVCPDNIFLRAVNSPTPLPLPLPWVGAYTCGSATFPPGMCIRTSGPPFSSSNYWVSKELISLCEPWQSPISAEVERPIWLPYSTYPYWYRIMKNVRAALADRVSLLHIPVAFLLHLFPTEKLVWCNLPK